MEERKDVPLMVRLPPDLHEEIRRFAAGNGKRPRSSLNAAMEFLLRSGLRAEQAKEQQGEIPPGNSALLPLAA